MSNPGLACRTLRSKPANMAQTPASKSILVISIPPISWANLTPKIRPVCRISSTHCGYFACRSAKPWLQAAMGRSGMAAAVRSSTVLATRHPNSAPPNVETWDQPSVSSHAPACSLSSVAAIG